MNQFFASFKSIFLLFAVLSTNVLVAQNALNFDGSNDYVQTSYEGVLGKADRTFEAWIKLDSSATGSNCILDYGLNKVGSRNTFSASDAGKLIFISGGTNANMSSSANSLPIGVWAHVAFVLDNGTGYMFVNGKQVGSANLSTVNTPGSGTDLRLGNRISGGSIPFKGSIDDVRIWKYARSATEISRDMGSELCSYQTDLEAYYKLNEGVASANNAKVDEAIDATANSNSGDLNNFTLSGSTSNWVSGKLSKGSLSGADTLSSCGKFKSPSGKTYTASGKYNDTLESTLGCDSFVTYNLTINTIPTKTINAVSCKTYVSPSGQKAWNKSGVYTDILPNPKGCDTLLTINLIVSKRSRDTVSIASCGALTSPSGKYTYTATGQYTDTLASIYNCDSIIITNFRQLETSNIISPVACDSYTSPSGNHIWTQSGVYTDTLSNSNSCDSIITINLTVNQTQFNTINQFSCNSYASPSGNYVYTQSGFYTDTIASRSGCDSIININLTIGQSTSSLNLSACDAYTSPSGKIWSVSGTYLDTIRNYKGCDSVMTITVNIGQTGFGKDVLSGCNAVLSPSGRHLYSVSGTYTDTLFRQTLCDSIIELEVTIDELQKPEVIRVDEETIESSVSGDAYKWYECDGYKLIAGANAKSFKPEQTIEYAVEVEKGSCLDTSTCYLYMSVKEPKAIELVKLYPNPAHSFLKVEVPNSFKIIEIRVVDFSGRIQPLHLSNSTNELDVSKMAKGIYTIEIVGEKSVVTKVFIKE